MSDFEDLQRTLPKRYTIERELGRGGMATVYLAKESHPQRSVAIKVLDPGLTARLGRQRFLREVDLASNLTHPHIVPIFAAGDAGGLLYYVMPYVAEESLLQRIANEGQLSLDAAVRITLEVADALEYAHQRNVVHRDIKPANILLHGEHAVVVDFGIARAIRAAESEPITEAGTTLGTPAYMSPEQCTAEEDIDGRADIYGLACVLYEMLAGKPPFRADTAQAILSKQLFDPVPPLRDIRDTVPATVEPIINKALAKAREDRFQRARDFSDALGAACRNVITGWTTPIPVRPSSLSARASGALSTVVRTGWGRSMAAALVIAAAGTLWWQPWRGPVGTAVAATNYIDSVAVMPFDNLTGDPQYDHLSAGITDEVIKHLSYVPQLKVISRHSVEALATAPLTTPQLLDTLGVQHILEGSLQLQLDQARITVQHIDNTDAHLGAETYEADLTDWFAAQEDIARRVTAAFVERIDGLTGGEAESHTAHSPGHASYLIGTSWLPRRTRPALSRAIDAFLQAITQDSMYAPGYAGLSTAYGLALAYRYDIGVDGYRAAGMALALADKALALDANLAGGYAARGFIASRSFAPPEDVTADCEQVMRLQPNAPDGPSWCSRVHAQAGNLEVAFAEAERAVALDPLSPGRRVALAYEALASGRYDLAIREANMASALEPDLMLARAIAARSLLLNGQAAQCAAMELGPHEAIRATCLYDLGRVAVAASTVDSITEAMGAGSQGDTIFTDVTRAEDLAAYYAWIGDADTSLQWLRRAYSLSPSGVEVRVLESKLFDRVRNEANFSQGVERIRAGIWERVRQESLQTSIGR